MIGFGYDIHRLAAGETLVLGGVTIPAARGTIAHSDGDVLLHALCDALLGAAALGDIGRHFPDTNPAHRGRPSTWFLAQVAAMIAGAGWRVVNVDCTLVLEAPRVAPHVDAMRAVIAATLDLTVARVSIKATTNEGTGAVGAGEAVAAFAVAQLNAR